MEALQKQVVTLSHKVDALYQVIEQLNGKVSETLTECRLTSTSGTNNSALRTDGARYSVSGHISYSPIMEHKDVLADGNCIDANPQNGDKQLTPEIQIQRLTAQLTAAYNRIAALEEQLLKERIH